MRTETLPFFSSRRTPRISSASCAEMPCAWRRSGLSARDPLVPELGVWCPLTWRSGRRCWLLLGTPYCIQNRSVKVKHIVLSTVTKIGAPCQSPRRPEISRPSPPPPPPPSYGNRSLGEVVPSMLSALG